MLSKFHNSFKINVFKNFYRVSYILKQKTYKYTIKNTHEMKPKKPIQNKIKFQLLK